MREKNPVDVSQKGMTDVNKLWKGKILKCRGIMAASCVHNTENI